MMGLWVISEFDLLFSFSVMRYVAFMIKTKMEPGQP